MIPSFLSFFLSLSLSLFFKIFLTYQKKSNQYSEYLFAWVCLYIFHCRYCRMMVNLHEVHVFVTRIENKQLCRQYYDDYFYKNKMNLNLAQLREK